MNTANDLRVGFIGQGYVGKNYADDFESRGISVVRYALEQPYAENKGKIKDCDIVFIAVPTPTTPNGFDDSIVREALTLVGNGRTAVIKSTVLPGTTKSLAAACVEKLVIFSPEFLSEATAGHDAANPFANILGIAQETDAYRSAAEDVHSLLPSAPFSLTCDSTEAEIIKYAHNVNGYFQIILSNLLYDLATAHHVTWEPVRQALTADPYISNRYTQPIHKSGRGAGGHCFIKDFAAFSRSYAEVVGDPLGSALLRAMEEKNKSLLRASGKDATLLDGVYGSSV